MYIYAKLFFVLRGCFRGILQIVKGKKKNGGFSSAVRLALCQIPLHKSVAVSIGTASQNLFASSIVKNNKAVSPATA
jgi:hypothetical protein